jgi:N-acylneuraminate cytidylyltransferase
MGKSTMTANAFIFARGGSKGLPGKNIKELAGKPLIQYSIEIAKQINIFENIFVSTEDSKIADIAEKLGAVVIKRPYELAQDTSPEWLAWKHAVLWVKEHYGDFDEFVSLPATSPLRNCTDVISAIEKRRIKKADACIAITGSNRSPYFNMVKYKINGDIELVINSNKKIFRRQDAPSVFDITTSVYAVLPEFILNFNNLFEGKVTAIEVPKNRSIDIDDIYDFKFAETILKESL